MTSDVICSIIQVTTQDNRKRNNIRSYIITTYVFILPYICTNVNMFFVILYYFLEKGFSMNIYERIKELCKKKGVAIKEMEIAVGIGEKNANKWKTRTPSAESLLKLSEYFGVSTDYILTGEDNGVSKQDYYFDQEIATIAQEIARHPGMKTLFEASRSLSDEDLQYVNDLIKRFKNK